MVTVTFRSTFDIKSKEIDKIHENVKRVERTVVMHTVHLLGGGVCNQLINIQTLNSSQYNCSIATAKLFIQPSLIVRSSHTMWVEVTSDEDKIWPSSAIENSGGILQSACQDTMRRIATVLPEISYCAANLKR